MADLTEEPFSFKFRKGGVVELRFHGRPVKTLKDKEAARFVNKVDNLNAYEAQHLMARVTGQFKMGTERKVNKNV